MCSLVLPRVGNEENSERVLELVVDASSPSSFLSHRPMICHSEQSYHRSFPCSCNNEADFCDGSYAPKLNVQSTDPTLLIARFRPWSSAPFLLTILLTVEVFL